MVVYGVVLLELNSVVHVANRINLITAVYNHIDMILLLQTELNYELSPLKSGTQYIVQLWATSSIGGGAMHTEVIKTPKIKRNLVMPGK